MYTFPSSGCSSIRRMQNVIKCIGYATNATYSRGARRQSTTMTTMITTMMTMTMGFTSVKINERSRRAREDGRRRIPQVRLTQTSSLFRFLRRGYECGRHFRSQIVTGEKRVMEVSLPIVMPRGTCRGHHRR